MKQGRPGLTRLMMLNSLLIGLRGQAAMQAEIIALRHQLTVFQRTQKQSGSCSMASTVAYGSGYRDCGRVGVPRDHGQA